MTYICAKQLANITMNQESTEYIVLYFLVLVGTLVVGVLARQFVLSKGVDNCKHSDKYIFYTLRFDCSFAAANTIKPQLL